MESISVQQASGWWGLLFSMAERQLSLMSRLSPTAFQFADTLGTTHFCSSNKDGFQLSRAALSAEEEKVVVDPRLNKEETINYCMQQAFIPNMANPMG